MEVCGNVKLSLSHPICEEDVPTKAYVDGVFFEAVANNLYRTAEGDYSLNDKRLRCVGDAILESDACNKKFVVDSINELKKTIVADAGAGGLKLETSAEDTSVVHAVADVLKKELNTIIHVENDVIDVKTKQLRGVAQPVEPSDAVPLQHLQAYTHSKEYINTEVVKELGELKRKIDARAASVDIENEGVIDVKKRRLVGVADPREALDGVNKQHLELYAASQDDVNAISESINRAITDLKLDISKQAAIMEVGDDYLDVQDRRISKASNPINSQDVVTLRHLEDYAYSKEYTDSVVVNHETDIKNLEDKLNIHVDHFDVDDEVVGIKGKRLSDVSDPEECQDAVTLHHLESYAHNKHHINNMEISLKQDIATLKTDLDTHLEEISITNNVFDVKNKRMVAVQNPVDEQDVVTLAYLSDYAHPKQFIDQWCIDNQSQLNDIQKNINSLQLAFAPTSEDSTSCCSKRLTNVCDPVHEQDVVTLNYLEKHAATQEGLQLVSEKAQNAIEIIEQSLKDHTDATSITTESFNIKNRRLSGCANPIHPQDAVTMSSLEEYAPSKLQFNQFNAATQEELSSVKEKLETQVNNVHVQEDCVDFKGKRLVNIANATAPQDAVTLGMLGTSTKTIMEWVQEAISGTEKRILNVIDENEHSVIKTLKDKVFVRFPLRIDSIPAMYDSPFYRLNNGHLTYTLPHEGTLEVMSITPTADKIQCKHNGNIIPIEEGATFAVRAKDKLQFKLIEGDEQHSTATFPLGIVFDYITKLDFSTDE